MSRALQERSATTRAAAEAAIDVFADKYAARYEKAARLLRLRRRALGPPAHLKPDRERVRDGASSNRGRREALSAKTAKLIVFKLITAAAKTWRRLNGENQLPKVVQGIKFQNGIEVIEMPAHHAA
jgi:putative transposase